MGFRVYVWVYMVGVGATFSQIFILVEDSLFGASGIAPVVGAEGHERQTIHVVNAADGEILEVVSHTFYILHLVAADLYGEFPFIILNLVGGGGIIYVVVARYFEAGHILIRIEAGIGRNEADDSLVAFQLHRAECRILVGKTFYAISTVAGHESKPLPYLLFLAGVDIVDLTRIYKVGSAYYSTVGNQIHTLLLAFAENGGIVGLRIVVVPSGEFDIVER